MMNCHLTLVVLAVLAGQYPSVAAASGRTITAASCSQEDVQKAIDAARDGDVVAVPAGAATWTTTSRARPAVLIENKSITLQGAGIDKTVITDGTTFAWVDLLLWIRGPKPARVTGFTFKGIRQQNPGAAAVAVHGGSKNWRIDHCRFENSPRGVWAYPGCEGLVDNCTFVNVGQGVVMKGDGPDDWQIPLKLGLPDAVYIEDCVFEMGESGGGATDGYHGARYVFRHNRLIDTGMGHHGNDSGDYRSTFSFEIYDNVFEKRALRGKAQKPWAMHFRGGTGVVFNNRIQGFATGCIDGANYRSNPAMRSLVGKWGICDGTNPIDGNEEPNGYPAQDQIGRSTNQILEPLYQWNNTLDGNEENFSVSTGRKEGIIRENRDYYNGTPRPGYKPYTYPHPLREQWPPAPPEDREPPAVPADVAARAVDERDVELTWKMSRDTAVAGYFVWLNGARVTTITDPEHMQYRFRRLKLPLSQHIFAVSAFDAARSESQESAAVKAAGE